jgi:hypothetical protein
MEVLTTTETTSSTSSNEDNGSWAGTVFSVLDDPRALCYFIGIYDYLLDDGDSDGSDSNDGGYKLTWP